MIVMRTFWCKGRPTLEDISMAYELLKIDDIAVSIEWFIPYNGRHQRILTRETLDKYPAPEKFFEESIPHCYGV